MYDILSQPLKEIILIYVMFFGACILTYPIMMLAITAAKKGLDKWR